MKNRFSITLLVASCFSLFLNGMELRSKEEDNYLKNKALQTVAHLQASTEIIDIISNNSDLFENNNEKDRVIGTIEKETSNLKEEIAHLTMLLMRNKLIVTALNNSTDKKSQHDIQEIASLNKTIAQHNEETIVVFDENPQKTTNKPPLINFISYSIGKNDILPDFPQSDDLNQPTPSILKRKPLSFLHTQDEENF